MKYPKKNQKPPESDTLILHKEMYRRRLRRLRQRGGLSEREIAVQVNDPTRYRRDPYEAEAELTSEVVEILDCPV